MTKIYNYFTNLLIARRQAGGGAPAPTGRAVHDTVTLSEGGHKIVNLARGQELTREIRAAPVDENFFANLLKAQEAIFRINCLFSETIKAAFQQSRR